jgi:uncharacterized protein YbjT (DUF2867 family)
MVPTVKGMTILVTGATGNVGRHLVSHLCDAGESVRALTRDPGKPGLPVGVEAVKGDLTDPRGADLAAALDGVTAAHLITFAGTADDPYAQLPQADADSVVAALKTAGVRRVTVLSGGDSPLETAVKASDLEWTILQPVEFMSGALDWVDSIRDEGVVRVGFADRRSAMVDEYDIGAVAAGVLARGGYARRELPISGPEVLTPADMVRIIGGAIGRDITLIPLTEDEAREQWRKEGFPDDVIDFFVWAHGNTPEIGYTVAPTVPDVTGRPARTLAQWAAENADRFR